MPSLTPQITDRFAFEQFLSCAKMSLAFGNCRACIVAHEKGAGRTSQSKVVDSRAVMTGKAETVLIGIDVGTSGVRAVAADPSGNVLAMAERPLRAERRTAEGIHEQHPRDWWIALCEATQMAVRDLTNPFTVAGIAVTSTSGSLLVTDASGLPLRPAILYDDARGSEIAQEINRDGRLQGLRVNSSHSVVKAAWVRRNEPDLWDRVAHLLHPADWLAGKLAGEFGVSDDSNSLKLGFDAESRKWNQAVTLAGLPPELLPRIVSPGRQVGSLSGKVSAETGLPAGIPVMAGATDGMASLIASGAFQSAHASTTLGTTLVWKCLATGKPALGPGMYCHLHPSGLWAPGAASNTGPGSFRPEDPAVPPAEMDRRAAARFPTSVLCYMLKSQGERFPFVNPQARTFVEGQTRGADDWYAAQLQSLSFVERWGYERLEACGVGVGNVVFSTGGAARSPVLSQLRADVLNRTVVRCRYPTAAFGAAILAAMDTLYGGDIREAIQTMTSACETYTPAKDLGRYEEIYALFRKACTQRGYS